MPRYPPDVETVSPASPERRQRHYGLDWLRIAAFALLIVYHVAMVFSPWSWVIKSPVTYPQLIAPMAVLTPWRLPLLFAVSGYASRALFAKTGQVPGFLRSRTVRLMAPLGFAMIALLPPEIWVRARLQGYPDSLGQFWLTDYWNPFPHYGQSFAQVDHLWFVLYLWAYTLVLGGLLMRPGWSAARLTRVAEWLADRGRLLWAPIAGLVTAKLAMLFVVSEREGLFTDWTAHAEYLPIFLFGFALAGSPRLWPAIARAVRPAAAVAVLAGAVVVWVELSYQGTHVPPHLVMAIDRSARLAMAWSMVLLLLHLAERFGNRDSRWRPVLAEAIFPFYIAHHPALVMLAWLTLPWGLDPFVEFALLTGGTVAFSLAVYLVGRQVRWLRPLIGLGMQPRSAVQSIAPAAA